jgi:hypothetical protein
MKLNFLAPNAPCVLVREKKTYSINSAYTVFESEDPGNPTKDTWPDVEHRRVDSTTGVSESLRREKKNRFIFLG